MNHDAPLLIALVYEKYECYAQALASRQTLSYLTNLGSASAYYWCAGHRIKGQCLAQTGNLDDAAQAFEAAATIDEVGLFLHELLAHEEDLRRIKLSVKKMLGPSPTAAQLASLSEAQFAEGVTWDDMLVA